MTLSAASIPCAWTQWTRSSIWQCSRWRSTIGASRQNGSGFAASYCLIATIAGTPPVNSTDRRRTEYAPGPPGDVSGSAGCVSPVSRSAENGAAAGTASVTVTGLAASCRANADPSRGSRTGWPPWSARTGTVAGMNSPTPRQRTVAATARAIAVRASSGRDGPGSTSKSMSLLSSVWSDLPTGRETVEEAAEHVARDGGDRDHQQGEGRGLAIGQVLLVVPELGSESLHAR